MRKTILLFIIFSAFLFSCRDEQAGDSPPETEVSTEAQDTPETPDLNPEQERAVIQDTIEVYSPRPGDTISSPLHIEGRARGYWFFEASFAVRLLDQNENKIAVVPAEAQESWITEDWVPFEATLEFDETDFKEGVLVFEKGESLRVGGACEGVTGEDHVLTVTLTAFQGLRQSEKLTAGELQTRRC